MLKPGHYVAEHDDGYFSRYRIVMDVKETEKSYIFKLVEYDNRYGYDHIKTMFSGKERKTIRKDKPSGHAMRVWGDDNFTIYPFQAGIPFYFRLEEGSKMKRISKKEAREKYGVSVSGANSINRYYLREDGCIVDDTGCIRYRPPLTAEANALLGEVHDYCTAFLKRSMYGECKAFCPLHRVNNKDGDIAMCSTAFIQENPGKVRAILDAEKSSVRG